MVTSVPSCRSKSPPRQVSTNAPSIAGAQRISPVTSRRRCSRMGYPRSEASLTFVYSSADSSTEYGPSTPASRSSESACATMSGYSRTSSGSLSSGLELDSRMPTIEAAGYPSKMARSSAKASFLAASLTGSQSESCAPRSTSSMADLLMVNGTRSRTSGLLSRR
ncbi:Uncharacterised protein [Mycobacteroides abscessus subsp. abscessus]|nr:Uncharacterised protein [Mycobacteroides abscessus subsp. abscessus]